MATGQCSPQEATSWPLEQLCHQLTSFLPRSIEPYPAYRCPAWRRPSHRAWHESAPWLSRWGTSPPWAEPSYTPPGLKKTTKSINIFLLFVCWSEEDEMWNIKPQKTTFLKQPSAGSKQPQVSETNFGKHLTHVYFYLTWLAHAPYANMEGEGFRSYTETKVRLKYL